MLNTMFHHVARPGVRAAGRRHFATGRSATMSSTTRSVGAVVFLGMAATTGYLGVWQMQRHSWKVDLIAERKDQLEHDPVPLGPLAEVVKDCKDKESTWQHRQVFCQGVFDDSKTMLCGPRSAPKNVNMGTAMSPSGYFLVTPFALVGEVDKPGILVNRGWIPKNQIDNLDQFKMDGVVQVSGVIAKSEKPTAMISDALGAEKNTLLYFDVDMMKEYAGIANDTLILNLTTNPSPASKSSALPVHKPIASYLEYGVAPETHLGYAATWFGLSLSCVVITLLKFLR